MTTTVRADLRAGLVSMLNDFTTSNPTLLRRTFPVRPETLLKDMPFAYVELGIETTGFSQGLRHRTYAPGVVVVDARTTNAETMGRKDALIDLLVEHMTGYPHLVAGSSWSNLTVADEVAEMGDGTTADATRIAFADFDKGEGRN